MTRPRTCSDQAILDAAATVVAAKPADWTLADVGRLVFLSAATLVQRFGSKAELERALLIYLNERDNYTAQSKVGDIVTTSCKSKRDAGLLAYRMVAAVGRNRDLRRLAMGGAS
jgi:hypothetical protein